MRRQRHRKARPGFSFLELQVAFIVFGIALSGLYPLVVMQSRQLKKIEDRFNDQTAYYLVPASDPWARKLGAAATIQTQDPGPALLPPVLTMNNGDAGYREAGSDWSGDSPANAFQGDLRWHSAGTGANTASWQFNGLLPGWYDVQVTWLEGPDRAGNSPYTVYDGTNVKGTFPVNQQATPVGSSYGGRPWQSLGLVSLRTQTLRVELSDQANGKVIADGVRLIAIRNDVQVRSFDRSLTSEEVTGHVSVSVLVPR